MASDSLRVRLIKRFVDLTEHLIFERRLHRLYRKVFHHNSISTVIDVGANKGQSIDFFLDLNPKAQIFALEPNPQLFSVLSLKYRNHTNVKLFNLGISNYSGKKLFFENVFDYTSSFESINEQSVYLKRKAQVLGVKPESIIAKQYPVLVITLGEFIKTHLPGKKIDVLKIDTEGHEYYCLEGLFNLTCQNPICYIQIENHNDDMYQNKIPYHVIKELLEGNNFFEMAVIRHGFSDLEEVIFQNSGCR